ncbi:MAG: helix-turn-helix domain-containing protein [Natronosporangium sp.]
MTLRRRRLAQRRRACGYSQEALAEALQVDRTTVVRWETADTEPQPWHRPKIARVLQVSLEELNELLADIAGVASTVSSNATTGATERLLAPPAAASSRSPAPGLATHVPGREMYASAIQSFRAADRQVGGGHLYATVVSYLHRNVAPQLFRSASDGDSQGVFAAAAALTEMAGWMAHDAGRDEAAWQHFARSLDLAQVGRDRQLTAHVLASMSHLAHHMAQPAEAIGHARRGQDRLSEGPRQPELAARLLAMEARGFASRREARQCKQLLSQAEAALGEPPDDAPSPWVSRFDEAALANEAARSLRQLGDFIGAGRQAERIVALRTSERTRSRAFGQLILVSALLSQGKLEEACAVAHDVLSATRHLGSYVVVRELLSLQQRLAPQRANPVVSTFLGCLEVGLHERRWLHVTHGQERQEQPADRATGHL